MVLDPAARKHGPSREALARLERLARGEPAEPDPADRATPEDGAATPPDIADPLP